jgi:hypothetical protein
VVLGSILASMAGFGTAGAAVGGLLGGMSGDEVVQETSQFIHHSIAAGKTVFVVEADPAPLDAAKAVCRSAGADIHDLVPSEAREFHDQAVAVQ